MLKRLLSILLLVPALAHAQSYKKLHRNATVIDTHNDVLTTVTLKGLNIENDLTGISHSDIARMKKGGIDIQVFSIFCDERFGKDTAFKFANIEIDSLYAIQSRNRNTMSMVRTPADLKEAVSKGRVGCMMGVEGGHMIEDRMDFLDSFYRRGVRYMTLTWNNSTSWATSAWDEKLKKDSLPHLGLTEFGKDVVKRMNALGMFIDLSHVGERTFYDAVQTSTSPVIASHSCAYALCPVPRNLKDDQIKAIGKNGGVIFLNFYSGFIDSTYAKRKDAFLARHKKEADSLKNIHFANYEIEEWIAKKYKEESDALRPPLSMLLDHLDYIVRLTGVDHVGLGSDFDGIESAPLQLDDVSRFPLITKELRKRGYSKKEVRKILGGNFIRVFEEVQGKAIP